MALESLGAPSYWGHRQSLLFEIFLLHISSLFKYKNTLSESAASAFSEYLQERQYSTGGMDSWNKGRVSLYTLFNHYFFATILLV